MSIFTRMRQGLGFVTRRNRVEADLKKEVGFHLQMETEQLVAKGLSPEEARRQALRDFGGIDSATEGIRDARGITFWDNLSQDVRFGLRSLRRSPGYTLAAIVTLGLGIGANTAIFGVVNGVLLHPLPYTDSGRIVEITQSRPKLPQSTLGVAIAEVWDYRKNLTTVEDVVEYHAMNFVLLDGGNASRVNTGVVSSSYFDTFGVKPLFGRTFRESDDELGAEPVLVLSNAYWLKQFGGDSHVIGKHVELNDKVHTIVGIMPPIPGYPNQDDIYMPTSACPFRAAAQTKIAQNRRAFGGLNVFARLKPGVTPEKADAEVQTVARTFSDARPDVYKGSTTGFRGNLALLEGRITQNARPIVFALLATTGLVLLIACANVANLSLSRTLRRDRELALRTALGARRTRLIRQLLTESTIVALAGGVLGVVLAWTTSGMLASFAGLFTPRAVDASVDGTVLLFALGVSMLTGVLFGLIPALTTKPSLVTALRDGAAQAGDNRRGIRIRSALVVAQVAVGFALVTGAGLLVESLYNLYSVDLGYEHADKVLSAEICCNFSHQQIGVSAAQSIRIYSNILDRAKTLPGVRMAAISNATPLGNITPFPQGATIEGQGDVDPARLPKVDQNVVSEDYFEMLNVPLLAGRAFTPADHVDTLPVAIINQTMTQLWGRRNPIGTTFTVGQPTPGPKPGDPPTPAPTYTVVGIVGDIRQYNVTDPALSEFYTPLQQIPGPLSAQLMVRTDGDATALAASLRAAIHEVDPLVPVENVRTLAELRQNRLTTPRLGAMMLAVFAALALLITLAGLGAVIATSVSQRTREFGLRMALGASRGSVLTMVVRQGAWMLGLGLLLGAGGAVAVGKALAQNLYGTTFTNPVTYIVVAALFVLAGLVACLGPARRATSIDPLQALREG
jgi:predicted permease